jgi:NADH:ubiquinone oxidoreductase subunit 3 (subunit A)
MDNKYYSYWLAVIVLSGIFYIIFGTSYALFGLDGFLIIAGVLFIVSILYGIWYSVSHESHN